MNSIWERARENTSQEEPELQEQPIENPQEQATENIEQESPSEVADPQPVDEDIVNKSFWEKAREPVTPPTPQEQEAKASLMQYATMQTVNALEYVAEWPGRMKSFFDNAIYTGYNTDIIEGKPVPHPNRPGSEFLKNALNPPGQPSYLYKPGEVRETVTKPLQELSGIGKEYIEPQGDWQKRSNETVKSIIDMMSPGSGTMSVPVRVTTAVAGNAAAETAKFLGFDEQKQELAKTLVMMGTGLANEANALRFSNNAMTQAERAFRGQLLNAGRMQLAIHRLRQRDWFRFGDPNAAAKQPAMRALQALEDNIQPNGFMPWEASFQIRKDINNAAQNLGAFGIERSGRAQAVNYLNEVRDVLIQGQARDGLLRNPQAYNYYELANQAWGMTQRSGAISRYIEKNYGKPFVSDAAKVAFGSAINAGLALSPTVVGGAVALATLGQSIRMMHRVYSSPLLRQHYTRALVHASQGNAQAMRSSLEKFDKAAEEEERKLNLYRSR